MRKVDDHDNIKVSVLMKNRHISRVNTEMKATRSNSSSDVISNKKVKVSGTLPSSIFAADLEPRCRSATPVSHQRLFNDMDSQKLLKSRLEYYHLDYVDDKEQHLKNIYDSNSRWFSRELQPKSCLENYLPYETESHKDQASYLCHVLINLYISINSLDIQGLISITSRDLNGFKQGIEGIMLNPDLSRYNGEDYDVAEFNDIADFDEDENEEAFEEMEVNEFIETGGPDFNATGKITAKSATVVNVNHWTNELKNCMHFDFPITLRKSLAVVYYSLSLVQGQKIYRQLHVEMFESLVSEDDESTNFTTLLLKAGLKLDYRPMREFLNDFLPSPGLGRRKYDMTSKSDLQLFRLLLKLSHQAKAFFYDEDQQLLKRTMDYFISALAPSTISCVLPIITSFVPYHYQEDCKITDYFGFLFSLWTSTSPSIVFDTHLYDFIGCVLHDAYIKLLQEQNENKRYSSLIKFEAFGLLTEDQANFIFNRIQNHLRNDYQIHSYSRTVRPLIYSIHGKHHDPFFEKLSSLIKSIETFVHPSNSGPWTKIISKFIHSFIKMYHERYMQEKLYTLSFMDDLKLNTTCHNKMIELFIDILILGSQNKDSDVANYYISSFAYLLDTKPDNSYLIFDRVLIDLYDSLTDQYINSNHRVITSLKQFTRIVRYMVIDPLYRIHITNIFSMLTSKIDANNIELTSNIINAIVSISSFIPLENFVLDDEFLTFESHTIPFIQEHLYFLKEGKQSIDFIRSKQILETVFRASTTEFENILKVYADKIFPLVDVDLEDGMIIKINQTTMIMMESMSDKIFCYFNQLLIKTFWSGDFFKERNPKYELITIPLGAAVRRDNLLGNKLFRDLAYNIRQQIEGGAGSIRSSSEIQHRDVKLVTYLTALNDILKQSYSSILEYKEELLELLEYVYDRITNPPLDVITSMLIHCALTSLTSIKITEYRLFPESSTIPMLERWGGLQFDDRKYMEEHLNFKWHVPTDTEIDFGLKLLEVFIEKSIYNIEQMITTPQPDSSYSDNLKKNILIITHALSGASLLFDPDFNKNKTELDNMDPCKRRLLLLKNMRSRFPDDQKLFIDVETLNVDNLSDDLETSSTGDMSDTLGVDNICITDMTGTDIVNDYSSVSELPSGVATPAPRSYDEDGLNCSLNGISSFQDLDIYSYHYFFGNNLDDKLNDSRYIKVHMIRSKVGKFFHKLFKFLSTSYSDNISIFQVLLHGLKVWFTDVGQETIFNDDPDSFIDLDFLDNIQTLSHLHEPYTRTFLAVNTQEFHETRVLMHSTNRVPSKLETILLKDIANLSMSIYPDIYKPAQACMVHAMKQLNGSYSIIMKKMIQGLTYNIENNNEKELEVILQLFFIKRIHRKLMSDYKHLNAISFLLLKASKITKSEVAVFADRLLNDIASGLKIPSTVCILDLSSIDVLKPLDNLIGTQIEAVKNSKEEKRKYYFSLLLFLQNQLIEYLDTEDDVSWKILVFTVKLISKTQSNLEFTSNPKVLEKIFKLTHLKHPTLIHLSLTAFTEICNKIISLGNYNYNLSNAYDSDFKGRYINVLDTDVPDFGSFFTQEMNNFENPQFFIDAKSFVGWMAWGRPLKVVKPIEQVLINIKEEDMKSLQIFGSLITRDWLTMITTILIQDNESRGVFSSTNISFFGLISHLISSKCCSLSYDELLGLISDIYDKNDKSSMIMSVEILAGLIVSSSHTSLENLKKRDKFLGKFLDYCFDRELNQDATDIWAMLCWWLPSNTDIRRCPILYQKLAHIRGLLNTTSDASSNQASRLLLLKILIISLEYRAPSHEELFSYLVFDHSYDQVRQEVGNLLCGLIQSKISPSLESVTKLVSLNNNVDGMGIELKNITPFLNQKIIAMFKDTEIERKTVRSLTPQEILKTRYYYLASTIFYWIAHLFKGPNKIILLPYINDYIAPFLLNLEKMRDVCKLANISPGKYYIGLAHIPLRRVYLRKLVSLLLNTDISSSNEIRIQLSFAEALFSNGLFQLEDTDKDTLLDFVVKAIFNENFMEVRIRASEVLSGIVHNLGYGSKLETLISLFEQGLRSEHSLNDKKLLSNTDINIHGSIIGLGAVISAFPYVFPLPRWIPKQLSNLSSWARTSGICGSSAKDIISRFKKVRADTWHLDRSIFSTDELEDLEGVLWRSYYA